MSNKNETPVAKTYEEMTTEELRELARERNGSRDESGVRLGKTKSDLIANLRDDDLLESTTRSTRYVETKGSVTKVNLDKIKVSPLNPRPEVDYLSPSLQASITQAGGLQSTISLYPAKLVDPNASDDEYHVLAGNRRFVNYKYLVSQGDYEDTVACVVRDYEGSPRLVRAQILAELENDNESLQFTPIDKLRLVNARLKDGRSPSSIAAERGWSESYLSQLRRLNRLPEAYLQMVHLGFRLEELKDRTPEELDTLNVPYEVTHNGVQVVTITYNNAQRAAGMIPKVSKNSSVQEQSDHEDLVQGFHDLYMEPEVVNAASTMGEAEFATYLEGRVNVLLGIVLPDPNEETKTKVKKEPKEEPNEFEKDSAEEKAKAAPKTMDLEKDSLQEILKHDVDGFVGILTATNNDGYFVMEIPDGWQEDVAPLLVEDPELRKALYVLLDRGVIVDQRNTTLTAAAE